MKFVRLIRAVLREIFEEAAYERFCSSQGILPGRTSYALFLREASLGERTKVKCC
jgi:hypothetical protein